MDLLKEKIKIKMLSMPKSVPLHTFKNQLSLMRITNEDVDKIIRELKLNGSIKVHKRNVIRK
jgi:hypothetical protein